MLNVKTTLIALMMTGTMVAAYAEPAKEDKKPEPTPVVTQVSVPAPAPTAPEVKKPVPQQVKEDRSNWKGEIPVPTLKFQGF